MTNEIVPRPATPVQLKLDLGIEVEKEVAGIEMGVLENGIPYLTQRGLAAMAKRGIAGHSVLRPNTTSPRLRV